MADVQEIIARLEAAEAGSRELDREIGEVTRAPMGNAGDVVGLGYAHFTTSLDAALALAERIIPGWWIELRRYSDGWYVKVAPHSSKEVDALQGFQKPAPLALCIAILKAKAQGEGG